MNHEGASAEDREIPSGRNAAEDVEGISLDFSVRQKVLESHAFLYGAWHFRNRCLTGIECDLEGSCRHHHRPPDRKADSDLCADDRIFLWKYPDFPGDQLCLDDD